MSKEIKVEDRIAQKEMHKNFFDKCKFAIDYGFYFEAVLIEYAAIESRLEAIMGSIGLPCGKFLQNNYRKDIKISQRIDCLKSIRKKTAVFNETKLPNKFFDNLKEWTKERNSCVHGLYKDEFKYNDRLNKAQSLAECGYEFCRLLYNEEKRIRRKKKNGSFDNSDVFCAKKCDFLK